MERIADYVIRKVNEAGAKHIFMITGRGILYLTDAVAKNSNIQSVSTYHEQGASYAAMAYASAGNGVSACLVSTGCASTNAVTACLCAYQDNLPVVFISGNNPLAENTRHTGVEIRTYGSQEADIISVVSTITKYSVMIESVESAAYEIEKSIYMALEGRKGPVWIDIPLDVQNMRIDEENVEHFIVPASNKTITDDEVNEVADFLNRSDRPIILVGGGCRNEDESIRALVELANIPAVSSQTASDIYGTANKMSIGVVGSLGGTRAGNMAIQNSDFVMALGTKLCSQLTGMKECFARNANVVVVDIDENEHRKNGIRINKLIIGDVRDFLERLLKRDLIRHDNSWVEKCIHWKKLFSIKNEEFVKQLFLEDKIDLYSLMDELSDVLPADATVITDAGFEELIVPSSIRYSSNQRCLFPAAQGAMGYAIPAIIGADTAGRKNIICVVGDGSIMMNIQELGIISDRKIPVKIIVINNNMYAVIRKRQTDLFRKRTIGNDPSDGVPSPDFRRIADCYGFRYRRINNRSELLKHLPMLFDGETEIIEIMCVPEQPYFHESYAINDNRKLVHRPIEDMSPFLSRELIKNEMIVDMVEE